LYAGPFIPFLGGLGLTVLLNSHARRPALSAVWVGCGIALVFVVVAASLRGAATDTGSGDCADGCWDLPSEREIAFFVVGISLGLWLLGVGVGTLVSRGRAAQHRRDSVDA
jgi:hypothetical protein